MRKQANLHTNVYLTPGLDQSQKRNIRVMKLLKKPVFIYEYWVNIPKVDKKKNATFRFIQENDKNWNKQKHTF